MGFLKKVLNAARKGAVKGVEKAKANHEKIRAKNKAKVKALAEKNGIPKPAVQKKQAPPPPPQAAKPVTS